MKILLNNKKIIIRGLIALLIILSAIVFIHFYNNTEKTELVSTTGRTFEKGIVTEILVDNLQENGIRTGEQTVAVKILSGDLEGQYYTATSSDGNLFGAVCEVGMKVSLIISTANGNSLVTVYSQDRELAIYGFVAVFLLLMCVIGGKNGIKSVLGLVYTFVCVIFMFMPMIYNGFSPFLAAVIVSIITTIVTMYLIGGITIKTLCAIIGTVLGVIMAGVSAAIFGEISGLSGYNVSNIETLLFVGQSTKIQIGGLLFAGILIAALGAVMDVAMSVSSTINEIHETDRSLSWKELFKSGMNVGRDMMGTMSNTLILAFTGGSLSTLVINYAYDLQYLQIINSGSIGLEIMQGISGSIGVIMTVPFVSFISAVLNSKFKKSHS